VLEDDALGEADVLADDDLDAVGDARNMLAFLGTDRPRIARSRGAPTGAAILPIHAAPKGYDAWAAGAWVYEDLAFQMLRIRQTILLAGQVTSVFTQRRDEDARWRPDILQDVRGAQADADELGAYLAQWQRILAVAMTLGERHASMPVPEAGAVLACAGCRVSPALAE